MKENVSEVALLDFQNNSFYFFCKKILHLCIVRPRYLAVIDSENSRVWVCSEHCYLATCEKQKAHQEKWAYCTKNHMRSQITSHLLWHDWWSEQPLRPFYFRSWLSPGRMPLSLGDRGEIHWKLLIFFGSLLDWGLNYVLHLPFDHHGEETCSRTSAVSSPREFRCTNTQFWAGKMECGRRQETLLLLCHAYLLTFPPQPLSQVYCDMPDPWCMFCSKHYSDQNRLLR